MKIVHYYFAPQSPYAYFGHARLLGMAARHGAAVEPKPFDLAAIFNESGGLPIAKRAPQRQAYRLAELQRWAAFLGLPLNLHPKCFPVDQTAASLLLVAARERDGADRALQLAGAMLRAVWAEERDIADAATLRALADDCGCDGAALLDASRTPETRRRYDGFNREALDAGIFGSPWYIVDGQGFWGQDRLDFVERLLQT
jgi:2-hydroxychromene-2-carboxylate isomerase